MGNIKFKKNHFLSEISEQPLTLKFEKRTKKLGLRMFQKMKGILHFSSRQKTSSYHSHFGKVEESIVCKIGSTLFDEGQV